MGRNLGVSGSGSPISTIFSVSQAVTDLKFTGLAASDSVFWLDIVHQGCPIHLIRLLNALGWVLDPVFDLTPSPGPSFPSRSFL